MTDRAENALAIISKHRTELREIHQKSYSDGDIVAAREKLKRWKERAVRDLGEGVHPREAQRLQEKKKGSFIMGQPQRNLDDEIGMYDGFLRALAEEIAAHPNDVLEVPVPTDASSKPSEVPAPSTSNSIFIIHGRPLQAIRVRFHRSFR
jgi:hypothetical protein